METDQEVIRCCNIVVLVETESGISLAEEVNNTNLALCWRQVNICYRIGSHCESKGRDLSNAGVGGQRACHSNCVCADSQIIAS